MSTTTAITEFKLYGFRVRTGEAKVWIIDPDGTEGWLWMKSHHIRDNIAEHGEHPELLKALAAVTHPSDPHDFGEPLDDWRKRIMATIEKKEATLMLTVEDRATNAARQIMGLGMITVEEVSAIIARALRDVTKQKETP